MYWKRDLAAIAVAKQYFSLYFIFYISYAHIFILLWKSCIIDLECPFVLVSSRMRYCEDQQEALPTGRQKKPFTITAPSTAVGENDSSSLDEQVTC